MVLHVDTVTAGYVKAVDILREVSLQVRAGIITTIIGPNGSGKSTVLKTIFGLLAPHTGKIQLQGEDITGLAPEKLVRRGLSYVPQETSVFLRMTVRENLEMGAYTRSDADVGRDIDRLLEAFPMLKDRQTELAGNLSGGQQQVLEMARALMLSPQLLMLDEPSAGLDPRAEKYVFETISRISEQGISILMVEQNARKALAISGYGYVMNLGRVVFEGSGGEILDNERIRAAYLGGRRG